MNWTAVLPLKHGAERKTRLAGRLSAQARSALSDAMAAHVIACLKGAPSIGRIILLSPVASDDPALDWCRDDGRGLNGELAALRDRLGAVPLLVIHGDLPLLTSDDVEAMLVADRVAIAPDAHGTGTNALALAPSHRGFAFAFGPNSCALHRATAGDYMLVQRPGLAIDVDTPGDLDRAVAAGFVMPAHIGAY